MFFLNKCIVKVIDFKNKTENKCHLKPKRMVLDHENSRKQTRMNGVP